MENKNCVYTLATVEAKPDWQSFLPLSGTKYVFDKKLGVYFDGSDVGTLVSDLLQFSCPYDKCSYVSPSGWAELKKHAKQTHQLQFW